MRVSSRSLVLTLFDEPVAQIMINADVDRLPVRGDPAGQCDEGGYAAAPRPGQPLVEGLFGCRSGSCSGQRETHAYDTLPRHRRRHRAVALARPAPLALQ